MFFAKFFSKPADAQPLDAEAARQSGAVPYKVVDGQVVFLIVTSRRTGRWIFPKGAPIEGLTPQAVAAREALEEAGVEGVVEDAPLGSYSAVKVKGVRRIGIEVDMYPLAVEAQHETWAETGQRHRHWALLPEARRLLSEPRLAEFAAQLQERILRSRQPGERVGEPPQPPANASISR
ncbi:MAG TPA: NUDIX hydrolase [Saliniramus sp.]|nr:NUDIX hydrolase [Saliniramus sp.]